MAKYISLLCVVHSLAAFGAWMCKYSPYLITIYLRLKIFTTSFILNKTPMKRVEQALTRVMIFHHSLLGENHYTVVLNDSDLVSKFGESPTAHPRHAFLLPRCW